jgi:hypothetical protein
MIHFKLYTPTFVELTTRPEWEEFATTEAVMRQFDEQAQLSTFHRFSQSLDIYSEGQPHWLLMLEMNEGHTWWIVGLSDTDLGLPEWKPRSRDDCVGAT